MITVFLYWYYEYRFSRGVTRAFDRTAPFLRHTLEVVTADKAQSNWQSRTAGHQLREDGRQEHNEVTWCPGWMLCKRDRCPAAISEGLSSNWSLHEEEHDQDWKRCNRKGTSSKEGTFLRTWAPATGLLQAHARPRLPPRPVPVQF